MEGHGHGEWNGGGRYLLFVSSATGYELREREGELPAVGSEVEDSERRYREQARALPAPRRPPALRLPDSRLGILRGDEAEHERGCQAAAVPAREDAARVRARRVQARDGGAGASRTRACVSMRRPPIVCVTAAATRTAVVPAVRRTSAPSSSADSTMSAIARPRTRRSSSESAIRYQAEGTCASDCARSFSCQAAFALEDRGAVVVDDLGPAAVELRRADEVGFAPASGGRRHGAAVELVLARGELGAARQGEGDPAAVRPRSCAKRQPAVLRKGRRTRLSPGRFRPPAPERLTEPTSTARTCRVSVSACVSKRRPTVSGLPVSRASTDAPSDSSQSSASSSRSHTSVCSAGSPRGQSRRNASSSRWRQITPLESSIDPPERVPRSSTRTSRPSCRSRAGGDEPRHPGARDGDVRQVSENVGLCSMYSSFTCSGPQTKSAIVFGASTTSSTSTPSSSASAMCSSTDSTRTPT